MTYDPKTGTIYLEKGSDFLADSGVRFVHELRKDSLDAKAPNSIKRDWKTITNWLECASGELTEEHNAKIVMAWKAYLAIGVAPSLKLQEVFDHSRYQYETADLDIKRNRAPTEVMNVFDRMLASDDEIAAKKDFDLKVEMMKLESVQGKLRSSKGPQGWLRSTSRNTRIIIIASVVWILWVAFRTSNDYELLGLYLNRWDGDMFIANALLPILAGIGALAAYKWISGARR